MRGAQARTLGWDKWRSDIRWELDPGSRAGMIGVSCEPDEEAVPGGSEVRHKRRRSYDDDANPSFSH